MNSVSKKIVSAVMMMLIIVTACSVFASLVHDCCAVDERVAHHQCCHCDDHADECTTHTYAVDHKCYEVEALDSECTPPQHRTEELQHYFLTYTFIYNLLTRSVDEPSWEVWLCDIFIDCYVPSAGLLRAPPAFKV
ncbi:MAG: hypothetical protein SNH35_03205 [Rikenellaceae bacterium]